MKKTLSIILSLSILLSILPLKMTMAVAAEYKGFTYTVADNEVTITGGDKSLTNISIPAEIDGLPVTAIGARAFSNYQQIQNVIIPDTVTSIGESCFDNCGKLKTVKLSGNITKIPNYIFSQCSDLTEINIPENVTEIGNCAFESCYGLTNLKFPGNVTYIGDEAFLGCNHVKSIILPKSVTIIGESNFYKVESLQYVYYTGSETDFEKIAMGNYNDELSNATIIYNYKEPATVTAVCGSGEANTEVDVTIELSAESNVCGGSFNIIYDNTKLEIVSVSAGSVISDRTSTINPTYATDTIRTSFVGVYPITNKGTILAIKFKILSGTTGTAAITIDKLRMSDFDTNIVTTTAVSGQVVILEHTHTWGSWSITTAPTKTTTGEAQRICSDDSSHIDTKALPVLTDTSVWTKGEYVAPTCDTNGSQTYISEYGTVTETIPATGHSWGAWSITTEPTKTETGAAERVCGNDSNHKDTMTLPKLTDNAVWTIGTYVAPTCENTGSQEYTSIYGTVTETIPATGHSWGAWSITTEPTKTETGSAERICSNDSSHKDTMTLPKLTDNAVWTIGAYVAPTCENTGSQEYTSIYGTVTETIPATGHSWGAWSITTEPTKTETGSAERVCGNDSSHKDTMTLPKLTDNAVWTIGTYVAPTCENTGSQEYTSIYGTVTETIPATGHSWGAWSITTEPTKTETGSAERVCGNDSSHKDTMTLPKLTDNAVWTIGTYVAPTCENTGSQEYTSIYGTVTETVPATGHSWGAWSITTEPTKTETGAAERVCGNDSNHKDTMTLPKLTDNAVWTIGTYVAPTCVNTGSQEYTSIYGTVTETIPATGHAWGAWSITTEPTKTETGSAERICDNDSSHKDTMTLPKLTDNAVWTIGTYVAPTCENTGSQEYTSIYGTATETIPATGHSWGAWSITIEPTKTETGSAEADGQYSMDNRYICSSYL